MTTKRLSGIHLARTIAVTVMLLSAQSSFSQNGQNDNIGGFIRNVTQFITQNTHKILDKTETVIEKYLDSKDSIYIMPNGYNFMVMPQYSYNFEYYRFSSEETGQGITLMPRISSKIGFYAGWRWLFFSRRIYADEY